MLTCSASDLEGYQKYFEPTFASARWALMHRFSSVCDWTKNHQTHAMYCLCKIKPKFYPSSTILQMVDFCTSYMGLRPLSNRLRSFKDHMGQCQPKAQDICRCANINVNLLHSINLLVKCVDKKEDAFYGISIIHSHRSQICLESSLYSLQLHVQ